MKNTPYSVAREIYQAVGVDTEKALKKLESIPLSLHCWQGDDVGGFEKANAALSGGGIQVTGNYPGKARTLSELRQDLNAAVRLIPGCHRLNLHASYADLQGKKLDRNAYTLAQFESWIDWCKERKMGMDFNPTCYSHPKADDGFTLSHSDSGIRKFWIEHGIACRKIAAGIGKALGSRTITNFWIPDGSKDLPANRFTPRERLEKSLDEIFSVPVDKKWNADAVEAKLFGIGSESYVVGSHEFYLGYAIKNQKMICLDAGHFHPTETLADKISSVLQFVPEVLLHVSRGVRWDSDHVVIGDDPTRAVMEEISRGNQWNRICVGLDFFDASINRIAAWVIGSRATLKCILVSLLEPSAAFQKAEDAGDNTTRLALMEEARSLPWGLVWDEYCRRKEVPVGDAWLKEVKSYEKSVLSKRG